MITVLAPKVLLDYLPPMITIPFIHPIHPIPSHPHIAVKTTSPLKIKSNQSNQSTNDYKWLPMTINDYQWLHSDYILTIYDYILATFLLRSGYILTTFWLHSDYILTTYWLHSDYILTIFWLYSGYNLPTFWLQSSYILTTSYLHSAYILPTFWLHSDYILTTFWLFLTIFDWLCEWLRGGGLTSQTFDLLF